MITSVTLYEEACAFAKKNAYLYTLNINQLTQLRINEFHTQLKKYYLQIVTTMFYELSRTRTSPLLSKFCLDNDVSFAFKNLRIEKEPSYYAQQSGVSSSSFDMHCILTGLSSSLSENLDTCAQIYDSTQIDVFQNRIIKSDFNTEQSLNIMLQTIDDYIGVSKQMKSAPESPPQRQSPIGVPDEEEEALIQELKGISKSRQADDEKIIDEIKKVQLDLQNEVAMIQNSLKEIADIRDGIDFATMREPIEQLIQLYQKLDNNLKRHPQSDVQKGYDSLIKRCNSFLKYIAQSLAMLGVELIDEAGGTIDPDKHKVEDDVRVSLNAIVEKIVSVGFMYKGKVIEKAVVEVIEPASNNAGRSIFGNRSIFGR